MKKKKKNDFICSALSKETFEEQKGLKQVTMVLKLIMSTYINYLHIPEGDCSLGAGGK